MTKRVYRSITLILLSLSTVLIAQEFKRYRAAKLDQAATEEARQVVSGEPGLEVTVYITADTFDKVCAFYKSVGHEYRVIGQRSRKLPNGQDLKDAFYLLDGAKDLMASKMWVKIQRPYIGAGLSRGAPSSEIRDVTAIVLSQKK